MSFLGVFDVSHTDVDDPSGECDNMIKTEVTLCHLEAQVLENSAGSPLVYSLQNLATIREEAK